MNPLNQSMNDLLDGAEHATALIIDGVTATRLELRQAADEAARFLLDKGFQRGDCLALWLPNGMAWMQLLFAASRLGVLIVPISTRYTAVEAKHLLQVSKARALVVTGQFLGINYASMAKTLLDEIDSLNDVIELADYNRFLATQAQQTTQTDLYYQDNLDDLLCCFSTSGTTGFPKLAPHGHASIVRHAFQVAAGLDIRPGDAFLCPLPLYGVFGFIGALAALAAGAPCIIMSVYDAPGCARLIEEHKVSHVIGSDAMFDAILSTPNANFSSWRRSAMADFVGLPLQIALRGEELGIKFSGTYGSSEVYSLMAFQDWNASTEQLAKAAGTPVDPLIEFRIVDPDSGVAVSAAQSGELQLRGPNVMLGYLNNPEASAKAFTQDGWYRTGDLAVYDGQGFNYLARMGDSLRLRGYLVNPAEIENVLMTFPGVAGAQVVGVNRPGIGDSAVAYLVQSESSIQSNQHLAEIDLIAYCKLHLAAYKIPVRIIVIAQFPSINGPNGIKIQKRQLREMASALLHR